MFKGKRILLAAILIGSIFAAIGSLVFSQSYFTEIQGGGLIFRQRNPVVRYTGTLSFQSLDGTTTNIKAPLTATATLDFASAAANTCSADLTVTVTGATTGEPVTVSPPAASVNAGSVFFAWVSTADTVAVRHCNVSAGGNDPASGSYRVDVWQH